MFVNRKNELQSLEYAWQTERTNFFIIYGRRRVGKTELIKQFLKNKPGFYFLADRLPERENLKTLTRILKEVFNDEFLADVADWYGFFRFLKSRITQKTVIIIDEFPYLIETNSALSSVFQKGWDEYLKDLPVFLILCGSGIGMMEREALTYKAPLYGRRTGQLLVKPFSFYDFKDFFQHLNFDTQLEFYAVTGGIPAYAQQLDPHLNLTKNILTRVFQPTAYLYQEVEFILKEEVREPRIYFSILKAIARGKRKFGEIVNETGIEKTSLHKYLYTLEELKIIEKEFPVTEKNVAKSRKGLYKITDHFFRFWFNFVFPYRSELEIGNNRVSLQRLEQQFIHLAAMCYEEVAIEICKRNKNFIFDFIKIGRWWEKDNEIDIVAYDESHENILFAEVKWSTKMVGTNIYRSLLEKSRLVDLSYNNVHFALFSRSGFTKDMIQLAKTESVLLITGENLAQNNNIL